MFPLSIGTMDDNTGSKITRKRCEIRDLGITENTFGVVYRLVE